MVSLPLPDFPGVSPRELQLPTWVGCGQLAGRVLIGVPRLTESNPELVLVLKVIGLLAEPTSLRQFTAEAPVDTNSTPSTIGLYLMFSAYTICCWDPVLLGQGTGVRLANGPSPGITCTNSWVRVL